MMASFNSRNLRNITDVTLVVTLSILGNSHESILPPNILSRMSDISSYSLLLGIRMSEQERNHQEKPKLYFLHFHTRGCWPGNPVPVPG